MNNIFLKNLTALYNKNSQLAEKLQKHIPTEIPKLVQENGVYNVLYKDKLIHNSQNPLAEANEIFSRAENTPVAIHIVYGMGLGYLFQVASLNSQGTVILYEPDLNMLWFAFTLVDFSNDISKKNVFVTDDYEEVTNEIYKQSGMKNTPVLLSLPTQRAFNSEGFTELVRNLQNIVGSFNLDLKYTKQKFYSSLRMLLRNLPNLFQEIPLARFKDVYKGKTAVVVSAGPTLDRNIEILKKHREKYVLFTVGTAVRTLYVNGIKPDFLCIIETYNSSKQIEGLDLSDVNFITEPYTHFVMRNFSFKNTYSHISANSPINSFWAEITGENIEEYWSKGTVSYTALNCARLLGCSKIVLVGQDLAYIEGQCYSRDSAYKDLCCGINKETGKWEIYAKDFKAFSEAISASADPNERENVAKDRLKNLNASLYYVKGINGDDIPTESVYATFIKPLQEYTEHFNDRKYINTSLVGANIDGYENMSLEEALSDSVPFERVELQTDFVYNENEIKSNLRVKLNELLSNLSVINEGKALTKRVNNELKRYRAVNQEVLKSLKKLSLNYLQISSDLANNSKLLDFIITADKIDLDYEMKMLKDFNLENVSNINDKISKFYNNAEKRILETERLINESIDTKS